MFQANRNRFELSKSQVVLPKYPEKPGEVTMQYLSLCALKLEKSPETDKRLKELCPRRIVLKKDAQLFDVMLKLSLQIESDIKTTIKGNDATVIMTSKDDSTKKIRKYTVKLVRQSIRWIVTHVKH